MVISDERLEELKRIATSPFPYADACRPKECLQSDLLEAYNEIIRLRDIIKLGDFNG